MRLINEHIIAKEYRNRWLEHCRGWDSSEDMIRALENLGSNPTLDQLNSIVGSSVSVPPCIECGKRDNDIEVIEIGEAILYTKVHMCLPCLVKALQLLDP